MFPKIIFINIAKWISAFDIWKCADGAAGEIIELTVYYANISGFGQKLQVIDSVQIPV